MKSSKKSFTLSKIFLIPLLFFLTTLSLDSFITWYGTSTKFGREGNEVVIWLWSIFGENNFLINIVYVLLVVSVSYVIFKKINRFLGLWILYGFAIGHLIGFSTWIGAYADHPLNITTLQTVEVAIVLGFLVVFITSKLRTKGLGSRV